MCTPHPQSISVCVCGSHTGDTQSQTCIHEYSFRWLPNFVAPTGTPSLKFQLFCVWIQHRGHLKQNMGSRASSHPLGQPPYDARILCRPLKYNFSKVSSTVISHSKLSSELTFEKMYQVHSDDNGSRWGQGLSRTTSAPSVAAASTHSMNDVTGTGLLLQITGLFQQRLFTQYSNIDMQARRVFCVRRLQGSLNSIQNSCCRSDVSGGDTRWQRCMRCRKLQVFFCERATI